MLRPMMITEFVRYVLVLIARPETKISVVFGSLEQDRSRVILAPHDVLHLRSLLEPRDW